MLNRRLLNRIVRDESLVRGLADPEARVLIEWLVDRAEELGQAADEERTASAVQKLCRRARAISRFVHLWCHQRAWVRVSAWQLIHRPQNALRERTSPAPEAVGGHDTSRR